jgi:creatinine amidohydrolase
VDGVTARVLTEPSAPDLADTTRARRPAPEHLDGSRSVRFGGPMTLGWTPDASWGGGVVCHPTGAPAERGEQQAMATSRGGAPTPSTRVDRAARP